MSVARKQNRKSPKLNLFRRPFFWLMVQLVITLGVLFWLDGLTSTRVPDTLSYLKTAQARELEDVLSHHRTFAYPMFLRAITSFGHRTRPVATVQIVLYVCSITLLWHALKRVSDSGWLAYAAVFPLPFAGVMRTATSVQPDFLAAVAAVVAVSFLLLLVSGRGRIGLWVGLGVAVFAAYQLRPAAIFLLVLIPTLGLVWKWLRGDRRRLGRWLLAVLVTTVAPFLFFCTLR